MAARNTMKKEIGRKEVKEMYLAIIQSTSDKDNLETADDESQRNDTPEWIQGNMERYLYKTYLLEYLRSEQSITKSR